MGRPLRIGIIGDFNPSYVHHVATNDSLDLAARRLGAEIEHTWVATDEIPDDPAPALDRYDGLWISPGSPYRSIDGALAAIRYAREARRPLIGT
jgi:CTP synthase (UTP-ammonia lyase)